MNVLSDQFKKSLVKSVGTDQFIPNLLKALEAVNQHDQKLRTEHEADLEKIYDQCTPEQLAAVHRLTKKMQWNVVGIHNTTVLISRGNERGFIHADGKYGKL